MTDTFTIAEIGQAHDGSLGILHSYIDALSSTGVDAVKFQMHIAEAESSSFEEFRVNFSYEDVTRYDYWKRMEFTFDQWLLIKKHCDDVGLEFICSPFSCLAVDWLEEIGVTRYKIGSGEVENLLMLEKIAKTGKDIILSSGMSSFTEIGDTISFLEEFGNNLIVLQYTTKYPTQAQDIELNTISEITERYGVASGLSDHSGKVYPLLAATALGAKVIEFHVVFDRQMFGPDSTSSLLISEVKSLVEGVKFINECARSDVNRSTANSFEKLKNIFGKSLAVNKNLKKGDILTLDDLESKKPLSIGISAKDYRKVIGKKVSRNMRQWDFIKKEDILE